MPAASWRIMPARSMSRCETISASLGVSRRIGRKYRERRMGGGDSGGRAGRWSETGSSPKIQGVNVPGADLPRRDTVIEPGHPGTVTPGQIRAFAVVFCLIKVPDI